MDLHTLSKCRCALVSISTVTGTKLPSQEVASSTRNTKANIQRKFKVNKITGPAAGIMTYRSTVPRHPSSIQGFIEHYDVLDFLLLCTPTWYLSSKGLTLVSQKLQIIRGEIFDMQTNPYLFQRMSSANQIYSNMRVLLYQLKNCSVRLSQEGGTQLEGAPRWAMDRKWTFRPMITNLPTLAIILDGHRLPTTLPISKHSIFQILAFFLFHRLLLVWRAFCSIVLLYPILRPYSKIQA